MRSVTITLDNDTATQAKARAAERGMSLSRYIGEILRRELRNGDVYDAAYRSWRAAKPFPLEGSPQEYPKRDEINERSQLRWITPMKERSLKIANQDGVDAFGPLADAFLRDILGHEEALITDESHLTDFIEFDLRGPAYEAAKEDIWRKIEAKYGIDVRPEVNILAVLQKIHWRGQA